MSRWVVLVWKGRKAVEHARCATWEAADQMRQGLYSQGHMVTIDDTETWDRACAQDEARAAVGRAAP